ncbi:MAG: GNAT family N-acetyltransferase [Vampirovibrio sp.]
MSIKSDTYAQFIRRYRINRFSMQDDRRLFNEALALRIQILVQEEGLPLEGEPDAFDCSATHWTVRHAETFQVLSTLRMRTIELPDPTGSDLLKPAVLLGKLVVRGEHRTEGIGRFLLVDVLTYIREHLKIKRIIAVAHVRSVPFFESMGFVLAPTITLDWPLAKGLLLMEKQGL